MKKNSHINVRVDSETKRKFQYKCDQLGISEAKFIEKIAHEPIVFFDEKVKKLIEISQNNKN